MTEWEAITEDEATAINAARDAVAAISRRARTGWNGGRVATICDVADWQLFQVLNHTSNYGGASLPDDVLHNRKKEPV